MFCDHSSIRCLAAHRLRTTVLVVALAVFNNFVNFLFPRESSTKTVYRVFLKTLNNFRGMFFAQNNEPFCVKTLHLSVMSHFTGRNREKSKPANRVHLQIVDSDVTTPVNHDETKEDTSNQTPLAPSATLQHWHMLQTWVLISQLLGTKQLVHCPIWHEQEAPRSSSHWPYETEPYCHRRKRCDGESSVNNAKSPKDFHDFCNHSTQFRHLLTERVCFWDHVNPPTSQSHCTKYQPPDKIS